MPAPPRQHAGTASLELHRGLSAGAVEQGDEADEAFGGMVARMDMPPHARAGRCGARRAGVRSDRMPVISTFFGIVIRMFYQEHRPPHFHAEYQGQQATFDFGGNLLAGDIRSGVAKRRYSRLGDPAGSPA